MNDIDVPSWLVKGAEVLAYTETYSDGRYRHPVITKIKKISTRSFTLEAEDEPRYSLIDCSCTQRDSWSAGTRYVVPLTSDQARYEIRREKERSQMKLTRYAVEVWRRSPTGENRLAAIAALQAIENDQA
jgi:hypothetical protein